MQLGQEAAEKLLMSCENFVKLKADRYKKTVDFDDGVQVGMLGLLKAIRDFDLNYDVKFITYGGLKARAAIQGVFRQKCREGYVQYDFANMPGKEEPKKPEIDLSRLDARKRYILEQVMLGRKMPEIAVDLKISKQRVRELREEAYEKLRETARIDDYYGDF